MSSLKYKQSECGFCYHLYNRGNQKRNIFLDDNDYLFYLKRLVEFSKKYGFYLCHCE